MRRRTLVIVLALLVGALAGNPARSDVEIVDPTGVLASPNTRFLANVPTGVAVGGHFMGRYFFMTTARSGVYLRGTVSAGGVWVFDAISPELPKPVAFLPLPHWENEDVDISPERKILLVTAERTRVSFAVGTCEGTLVTAGQEPSQCPVVPPTLFVIDISDPTSPRIRSQLEMPAYDGKDSKGNLLRGPGHIANCILDCRYAYITASRKNQGVFVVDLRDLDHPKIAGQVWNSPAGLANTSYPEKGATHDVNVDSYGNIWMTGSGGTAMYAPVTDSTVNNPTLVSHVKAITTDDEHPNPYNALIHHSSLRLNSSMVMVNEESYSGQCGQSRNPMDEVLRDDLQQGSFQIWRIDGPALEPVSTWKVESAEYTAGGGVAALACSSHWFTMNQHGVVAVAWYDQGVRFLDVSNPAAIKQVGYHIQPNASTSAAYFVPWRPDIVYVADYSRGLDVVKIDRGGRASPAVTAPIRADWLANYQGVRFAPALEPDPDFGYACLRPAGLGY